MNDQMIGKTKYLLYNSIFGIMCSVELTTGTRLTPTHIATKQCHYNIYNGLSLCNKKAQDICYKVYAYFCLMCVKQVKQLQNMKDHPTKKCD